jgi:hypothetical protein
MAESGDRKRFVRNDFPRACVVRGKLQRLAKMNAKQQNGDTKMSDKKRRCTKCAHTPRPWQHDGVGGLYGTPAAECIGDVSDHGCGDAVAAANAAHIVRCVNAHDALVDSLKSLLNIFDRGIDGESKVCDDARAALTLAEGGTPCENG